VVEPDADRRALREASFERLKFAVAAFPQAEPALAALNWFSPDVVVIDRREARAFREAVQAIPHVAPPVVEFSPDVESDEAVIDAVRVALRASIALKTQQTPD
jgi:DNA-binding NtrC family response regulator